MYSRQMTFREVFRMCQAASLLMVLFMMTASPVSAQRVRARYIDPTFSLVLGGGGGVTKYFGEFTDQHFGTVFQVYGKFFVIPEVSVQIDAGFGNYVYNRRNKEKFKGNYFRQFHYDPLFNNATSYNDPDVWKESMKTNSMTFVELRGVLNFFPRRYFNPYLSAGMGIFSYTNSDVKDSEGGTRRLEVLPNGKLFYVIDPANAGKSVGPAVSDLESGYDNLTVVPIGLGFDIMINRRIAFNLDFTYRIVLGRGNDYLDGFGREVLENFQQLDPRTNIHQDESSDAWGTITVGVQVYLLGQR